MSQLLDEESPALRSKLTVLQASLASTNTNKQICHSDRQPLQIYITMLPRVKAADDGRAVVPRRGDSEAVYKAVAKSVDSYRVNNMEALAPGQQSLA